MTNEESESVEPIQYAGQFRWTCSRGDCQDRLIIAYSQQTLDVRIDMHVQAHLRNHGQLIQNPNVLTLTDKDIKFLKDAHIEAAQFVFDSRYPPDNKRFVYRGDGAAWADATWALSEMLRTLAAQPTPAPKE